MKLVTCARCGASDLIESDGYRICHYCRSKYVIHSDDIMAQDSIIALDNDVKMLLQKCRDNPASARRYANLVLDIDPGNVEARKYI